MKRSETACTGPAAGGDTIVASHREDPVLDGHAVQGDAVRVETVTQVREQRVEVTLMHERVEIVHVPVGRFVDRMREIRHEGDLTIMPVVEEVLVVERRLRLVEEVHIRRVEQFEQRAETVVLRTQDAKVTRRPGKTAGPASPVTAKGTE